MSLNYFYYTYNLNSAIKKNIHQIAEPIVGNADVIAARNNNSSPIEHRISVEQYKYDLYKTFQKSIELANTYYTIKNLYN